MDPADPMAQLPVVLLALFGQVERTYTLERTAYLRDTGHTIAELVAKTGIARTGTVFWPERMKPS